MTFLLTFLFLASRLLRLLFCCADISDEELVRGMLAKALTEGLKLPFFDYAIDHYVEGALVYGVFTVPSFLLFGKNVFALRLTALLFQLGAFFIWYLLMKRFFGKRPALYTALLYLCSPPWLTLFATLGNGSHAESLLFTALGLFLLYKVLYEERKRERSALFLGLVCGFGSYFTYSLLVSTLSFLLFWFYEDRKMFRKREFSFFLLFFLIGFSPWIVYNLLYRFQGIEILKAAFVYPYQEKIFVIPFRLFKLATLKILGVLSFNYREGANVYGPHMTLLNVFYYAVLLSSYGILHRFGKKDRKTRFFFLFPIVYLGIASVSRFVMDTYLNRYLIPLFPFFFAVIALGLTHLGSLSRELRKVSVLVLVLLLAMGLKGELNLLSFKDFGLSLKYRGYSYRGLALALTYRYPDDSKRIAALGKKLEPSLSAGERVSFYNVLSSFQYPAENSGDLQKYSQWIEGFDEKDRPFFLQEMGRIIGLSERPFLEEADRVTSVLPMENQPYAIEGLAESFGILQMKPGRVFKDSSKWRKKLSLNNQRALAFGLGKLSWQSSPTYSFEYKIRNRHTLESLFPPKLLPLYYRGVGALMTDMYDPLYREWPFSLEDKLKGIEKTYQEAIYWGAGFETPLLYEDPFEYERMNQGIPPEFRETFKRGLQDRLSWGGRNYWIEGKEKMARREE